MSELTKIVLRLLCSGHREERNGLGQGSVVFLTAKSARSMRPSYCDGPGFMDLAWDELGHSPGYTCPQCAPRWKLPWRGFPAIKNSEGSLSLCRYHIHTCMHMHTHAHACMHMHTHTPIYNHSIVLCSDVSNLCFPFLML